MFLRIFFLSSLFVLSLYAVPSLSQLQDAVAKDPSLLDTPEATAIMQEKGLSKEQIKAKLAKNKKLETATIQTADIENNLAIADSNQSDNNLTAENKTSDANVSNDTLEKRLNPFTYKTNAELRKLAKKQQQHSKIKVLRRYSSAFYANRNTIDTASLVTPDNYTIAAGDELELYIYGDRDEKQSLTVQNDGTVQLAYIGPVKIGGMSYKDAKEHITTQLKHHFKTSSFKLVMSKYSSIQVTLIGDVKNPGIYNLSSFSTVKDILIASKGVRKSASVRDIVVKRKGKVIADIDFYDLLFHGKDIATTLLKHGDIVIVKQANILVSVDGYTNNSAIFELKKGESLAKLIYYAGGMKAEASSRAIKVERYAHNTLIQTFQVSYAKAKSFAMQNGDKVYIYKLDESDDKSINIYGNVIRPGSYTLGKSATLNTLLQSALKNGMKKFFLPDTALHYATLKHYSKFLEYEVKSFDLQKVIDNEIEIKLAPQDELFIFNTNDLQTNLYITTVGDILIQDGKFKYFKGMSLKDAVNAAGLNGIMDDKVRVTTIETQDGLPHTHYYSYKKDADVELHPYDEVEVYDYYKTHVIDPVSIKGEVVEPKVVFYEQDMSLASLINATGGLTKMAYKNKLEIVRYYIGSDQSRKKKIIYVDLSKTDAKTYRLKPYDEVTIYKIPNWGEKKTVTLSGAVKFPGTYTIGESEKLSSVIERAGGYTKEAFVQGAVFTRESIRKRQMQEYNRSLAKIKRELALYNAMPANAKKAAVSTTTTAALDDVITEAKKYAPVGRVSVNLEKNLKDFKDSKFDLVLQDKDKLFIPNQIDTITVFGEVFNPTSFVFDAVKSVDDYIAMASGLSRSADASNIYVVHANGISEPVNKSWFSTPIEIQRGDTIVIPVYIKETNNLDLWDSVSRILASFAITAATMHTLGVL